MTKRFTDHGFTLEFSDNNVSQDFVERAFQVVRTRPSAKDLRFSGECDVWLVDESGERHQLYRKRLKPRVRGKTAKEAS